MRRASGQPRLSHGITLNGGQRSFNLPTRRRSCCSTSPLPRVDLAELVSPALGSVTEVGSTAGNSREHETPDRQLHTTPESAFRSRAPKAWPRVIAAPTETREPTRVS